MRLKSEMEELRSKFDTLLEASLQQMNRDDYANNLSYNAVPSSTGNSNLTSSTGSDKSKRMSPTSSSNTNPLLAVTMTGGDDLSPHANNNSNTSPSSLTVSGNDKNRGTPSKNPPGQKKNFLMKSISHLVGNEKEKGDKKRQTEER